MQTQENNRRNDYQAEIKYIGVRISYFRKLKGMTQAELAEKVHTNKNYLSQIESGSADKVISLPLLIEMSKALDIELSLLVDLNDFTQSKNEIRQQFEEMKLLFEQMKNFNSELDKMIADMGKADSVAAV